MEFIRNFSRDDEKVVGLCGFKDKMPKIHNITPDFTRRDIVYFTNTKNNFLLS